MHRIEDYAAAARCARAYARGAYSNCDGFLLSLSGRGKDDCIYFEELPGKGVLFLLEHPQFIDLFAVGQFPEAIALSPQPKPVLFTHVRGQPPELAEFAFFRSACRMELRDRETIAHAASPQVTQAAPGEETALLALMAASLPAVDLPDRIDPEHFYCIRSGGRIVACAGADVTGKGCVLAHIAVAADMRRQGLGRALVEGSVAAARARGAEYFFLWVDEANLAAVRLYERCGFHKTNHSTKQWIKNKE